MKDLKIPIAIVIGAILISISIYISFQSISPPHKEYQACLERNGYKDDDINKPYIAKDCRDEVGLSF